MGDLMCNQNQEANVGVRGAANKQIDFHKHYVRQRSVQDSLEHHARMWFLAYPSPQRAVRLPSNYHDIFNDVVLSLILPGLLQPGLEPFRRHIDQGVEVRRDEVEASIGSGDQGDGPKLSLYILRSPRKLERGFHALGVVMCFFELYAYCY